MIVKNIIRVCICFTATVIGNLALELPSECNHYLILDDHTRNVDHGNEGYADSEFCSADRTSPDWQGQRQWYRLM